jgi:hypothetical protein
MAAAAFLVITRDTAKKGLDDNPEPELIRLTINEIRKLFNRITAPIQPPSPTPSTGHTGDEPAKHELAPATAVDEVTICRCSSSEASPRTV